MSLLLDALERVKTNQRVLVATPRPSIAPAGQGESSQRPLLEVAATPLTAPRSTVTPADTGASHDTLAWQFRQVAENILATYPNVDALGLAFVTPAWPSEAPRFLPELARAMARCAGGEVLVVHGAGEFELERSWQSWKRRHRYVIVQSEGGPNDVELLAGADGVYLAVVLGKTPRQSVKDSIARLHVAGAPIRGSVLIGQTLSSAPRRPN